MTGSITNSVTPRAADGRFPAGVSGNPNGRPVGKKNEITELQQDLELAIRRNISSDRVSKIIVKMIEAAEQGSIQAARLILDKVLPNAHSSDDDHDAVRQLVIRIENATQGAPITVYGEAQAARVFESGETPTKETQ